MLTYEDCLGLSTLTDEEVSAIAEHEQADHPGRYHQFRDTGRWRQGAEAAPGAVAFSRYPSRQPEESAELMTGLKEARRRARSPAPPNGEPST